MPNVPLMQDVIRHIATYPELHNQDWFFQPTDCGTAMCFAGWACYLSGMDRVSPDSPEDFTVETPTGISGPWDAAQDVLGISTQEAYRLFSGINTRSMLEAMVKDFTNTGELNPDWTYYDPRP